MDIAEYFPKGFLERQGRDFPALAARLSEAGDTFVAAISELDDERFYRPAAAGKWSPAQIADHLVRANRLFARALERAKAGEGDDLIRMPRGRVTEDGRAISPEEPIPNRVQGELLRDFRASLERLKAASEGAEPGKLCLEHSFFGEMTGLEVLQLAAWHIRHHTKQLPRELEAEG